MPSKKYIELQEFTDEELKSELTETMEQYRKIQFDHSIKGLENPLSLREVRRDIARLQTEVRAREMKAMPAEEKALRTKKVARRRKK